MPSITNPEQKLIKFAHDEIPTILSLLLLEEPLQMQIAQMHSAVAIIHTLVTSEQYAAAIKLLALGLPAREAVWWSYLSVAQLYKEESNHLITNALDIIKSWVYQPNQQTRRYAKVLADQLTLQIPLGWVATAVFWSGGSISPADSFEVEPEPMMCGHAVSNAILMTATSLKNTKDYFLYFIKQGIHIAMGGNGQA